MELRNACIEFQGLDGELANYVLAAIGRPVQTVEDFVGNHVVTLGRFGTKGDALHFTHQVLPLRP